MITKTKYIRDHKQTRDEEASKQQILIDKHQEKYFFYTS